ncbi:MAG: glycosyl hydrolase family 17 protein [Flavobacteriales bacterium]
MSYRADKVLSLAGDGPNRLDRAQLRKQCALLVDEKMHGVCFSPYEGDQQPGDSFTEAQVRRKLELLQPHTKWIRIFSCTDGNDLIPQLAREYGFKTLVGAWLGEKKDKNEEEMTRLVELARASFVDVAAVGNEVLYREDLDEDELIACIDRVRNALPDVPVGYVDAYYEFSDRPLLAEACDVILANCYPYWEGCHMDYSLLYMKQMYYQVKQAQPDKKIIITETGWPSEGEALGAAEPSYNNALKYFINAQTWARKEGIDMFYFAAFDEAWKVGTEGSVGAFWGLWDKDEKRKF